MRILTTTAIFFVMSCAGLFSQSASAQTLNACPNVQMGNQGAVPAIYSDCSIETTDGTPGFHLTMYFVGGFVYADGREGDWFEPAPVGDEPIGRWDGLDLLVEDMGRGYTGSCSDMSPNPIVNTSVTAVDGNVYCMRISNRDGRQFWLKGTANVPDTANVLSSTWTNASVSTNQPGVGAPITPVPALPLWALWVLAGVAGMFGANRLRKQS